MMKFYLVHTKRADNLADNNLVMPLRNEPSKLLGTGLDGPLVLGIALNHIIRL